MSRDTFLSSANHAWSLHYKPPQTSSSVTVPIYQNTHTHTHAFCTVMRDDQYKIVAHMGFPLKGFIFACLLSPSPSIFLSPRSLLSLPAAAVNYKTETFFVPTGCKTHTHISVPHGLEFEWMSVSPVTCEKLNSTLIRPASTQRAEQHRQDQRREVHCK